VIVFSLFSLDLISCIGKTRLKESQTLLKKRLAKAEQFCESEDVKNAFDEVVFFPFSSVDTGSHGYLLNLKIWNVSYSNTKPKYQLWVAPISGFSTK